MGRQGDRLTDHLGTVVAERMLDLVHGLGLILFCECSCAVRLAYVTFLVVRLRQVVCFVLELGICCNRVVMTDFCVIVSFLVL